MLTKYNMQRLHCRKRQFLISYMVHNYTDNNAWSETTQLFYKLSNFAFPLFKNYFIVSSRAFAINKILYSKIKITWKINLWTKIKTPLIKTPRKSISSIINLSLPFPAMISLLVFTEKQNPHYLIALPNRSMLAHWYIICFSLGGPGSNPGMEQIIWERLM